MSELIVQVLTNTVTRSSFVRVVLAEIQELVT